MSPPVRTVSAAAARVAVRLGGIPPRLRRANPWRRPRVGLVGFYGWGNYGDELFHRVYEEHLGEHVDLRVLHDRLEPPYFSGPVARAVDAVDAVVIGGGDLVIPWQLSALYWQRAYLRRPVFVTGVGVPQRTRRPHASPQAMQALRAFFAHPNVRQISARDEKSARWIERNLRPGVPVRRTADLVCALSLPPASPPPGPPVLGVVTRARRWVDDYAALEALARRAVDRGMRVRHIVLGTGRVGERDAGDAARLGLPGRELVVADDLDTLSRAIGECRVLASMKFHGSVVAAMYGVPSLVLVTTAKNRRFFTRLGRPDLIVGLGAADLPDRLDPLPDPIDPAAVADLRADATGTLESLRDGLLGTV